jgi:hypothetical protein
MTRKLSVDIRFDPPNPAPTPDEMNELFDEELARFESHIRTAGSSKDPLTRLERTMLKGYMVFAVTVPRG